MLIATATVGCKVPVISQLTENKTVPKTFSNSSDSTNSGSFVWTTFFTDQNLTNLIDTALKNNQELQITLQEIEIASNDVRFRRGKLLPTVGAKLGVGAEKVGRYTSQGAGDATTDIAPGIEMPEPLMDYTAAAYANWEVDIWKKLRNSKKAAVSRYLATVEGKNFVLTTLIAEVANSYYELLGLDNQLAVVQQNIALQKNALELIKVQKRQHGLQN